MNKISKTVSCYHKNEQLNESVNQKIYALIMQLIIKLYWDSQQCLLFNMPEYQNPTVSDLSER